MNKSNLKKRLNHIKGRKYKRLLVVFTSDAIYMCSSKLGVKGKQFIELNDDGDIVNHNSDYSLSKFISSSISDIHMRLFSLEECIEMIEDLQEG